MRRALRDDRRDMAYRSPVGGGIGDEEERGVEKGEVQGDEGMEYMRAVVGQRAKECAARWQWSRLLERAVSDPTTPAQVSRSRLVTRAVQADGRFSPACPPEST